MADQRGLRKIRMANEYDMLMRMSTPGGIMEITGNNGRASDHYTILFRIPTIIRFGPTGPVYRQVSTVDISIPPDYPYGLPLAIMREQPPWHPNWYKDSRWCSGLLTCEHEPLWEHVKRMAETIRFNPKFTNPKSPANKEAVADWNKASNKRYFPTSHAPLPTGDKRTGAKGGIVIHHM